MPFVFMHLAHANGPGVTVVLGAFFLLLGAAMIVRGRYE